MMQKIRNPAYTIWEVFPLSFDIMCDIVSLTPIGHHIKKIKKKL
jgi:hypothetical protein